MPPSLPSDLLAAVAASGAERICIVVGAGCSFDTPTCLPLSKDLAKQAYDQLVADGVIKAEDCPDPTDLALLADAVWRAKDSQRELVMRLGPERLSSAQPNDGYKLSVALMLEGVVRTIITLNYDLALTHALAAVGASDRISTIKEPKEWSRGKGRLVIYLHGNVEGEWDRLVFRTCQLNDEWKEGWEQVVAQASLAAPTLLFAGLGSPAPVLSTSAEWIRSKLTGEVFLADPVPRDRSGFAEALDVDDAHYIPLGWNVLLKALGERFLAEHGRLLQAAVAANAAANGVPAVDLSNVFSQLAASGVVTLGQARQQWLRQEPGYSPLAESISNDLVCELLTALAAVVGHTNGTARLSPDGVIEVRVGSRILGRLALASGRGALTQDALRMRAICSLERSATTDPLPSVVVTGATSRPAVDVSPPADITGAPEPGDVVTAVVEPAFYALEAVRVDPCLVVQAWGVSGG